VNLKEPLPSTTLNGHQSIETLNNHTPIDVLRETTNIDNPNYDQFTYQFVIQSISSSFCFCFSFRLFFERDQILENIQEILRTFDNDVCLLYYLKIIKTLRAKETDLRCVTFYEELMLMKEFERTENDLENKVAEAQKRFDAEQIKVQTKTDDSFIQSKFCCVFRSMNFKEKSMEKRKILIV